MEIRSPKSKPIEFNQWSVYTFTSFSTKKLFEAGEVQQLNFD